MLCNGFISFEVELQGLTAHSTTEAELVVVASAMKESVFCSNMMTELGYGKGLDGVPIPVDKTSALRGASNRTFIPRVKHVALRYLFIQELVDEGKVSINQVS